MQALGFKISSVTLFWFCVQWSWGTIRNKNVFCDKFSCLIWTQIKENRNKHENETLYIRACMYLYFMAWILFKLVNVAMFSKTGKQFLKQYKITSWQMFFNPFTPKICKLILPTRDHTKLWWLFLRIWCYVKTLPWVDSFLRVSLPICLMLYSDCKDNLYVCHSWELKG